MKDAKEDRKENYIKGYMEFVKEGYMEILEESSMKSINKIVDIIKDKELIELVREFEFGPSSIYEFERHYHKRNISSMDWIVIRPIENDREATESYIDIVDGDLLQRAIKDEDVPVVAVFSTKVAIFNDNKELLGFFEKYHVSTEMTDSEEDMADNEEELNYSGAAV